MPLGNQVQLYDIHMSGPERISKFVFPREFRRFPRRQLRRSRDKPRDPRENN